MWQLVRFIVVEEVRSQKDRARSPANKGFVVAQAVEVREFEGVEQFLKAHSGRLPSKLVCPFGIASGCLRIRRHPADPDRSCGGSSLHPALPGRSIQRT